MYNKINLSQETISFTVTLIFLKKRKEILHPASTGGEVRYIHSLCRHTHCSALTAWVTLGESPSLFTFHCPHRRNGCSYLCLPHRIVVTNEKVIVLKYHPNVNTLKLKRNESLLRAREVSVKKRCWTDEPLGDGCIIIWFFSPN